MLKAFDVLVLGAGAAGLMCAIEAGKRGRKVALIERSDRIGKKILISGGGRCNFTNLYCKPENFLSANPHFCKSALARYTPNDFIALVKKHRIAYHEKTKGQLFCDGSAKQIVDMLVEECRTAGVQIFPGKSIDDVRREEKFVVSVGEDEFQSESLVVATGGLSIPKIGATGFGYDVARRFGLKVRPSYPALVPLVFDSGACSRFADLAGVSTHARVECRGQSFEDKILFTHRGLSGPAMLQISSYWRDRLPIYIDLAPGVDATAPLQAASSGRSTGSLKAALRLALPHRLVERWLELHPVTNWTNAGLEQWERTLHNWEVPLSGTEGFEKAEVTAGGVDTNELSSKTMQCNRVPGLYFVGEVVDVTGQLGGFNFQWAWASGHAAGQLV